MNFFSTKRMNLHQARWYPNYWDTIALLIVLAVIALFAWNAKQMTTPYQLGQVIPISLNPRMLPLYAARTVVRMLLALVVSLLFTFIFGTWAAKSPRARRIIIPIIDILQSVPILGYLSVAIIAFIALFPGSELGPESATIFVIFTSQAWNMMLGFYQTMRSVPAEIKEAARMMRLTPWQTFWRIEVPFSMPGLLWNTMVSMSASWFFVVASEAMTVSNQQILLPGVGSYIAVAIQAANIRAICYAVLTMFIVIIIYDQLLFRPLVAWSEKFKTDREATDTDKESESWVVDLFRRTRFMRLVGLWLTSLFNAFVNIRFYTAMHSQQPPAHQQSIHHRITSLIWLGLTFICGLAALTYLAIYLHNNFIWPEIGHVFILGLITSFRVFIMIAICSLIWVPIGVWIGLHPRVTRIAQPLAQILAAFPANLFYPFVVIFIVTFHLSPNIWLTPLMILGSQWYILFNVIAGASSIPKDLFQVTANFNVKGKLRWLRLLLPAIFPFYVTGAITAAGGAWNASIVAEVASWGKKTLTATGLGAYITQNTSTGHFENIALGIGMMCVLVLIFNRLIWRPLYDYAESRFTLD